MAATPAEQLIAVEGFEEPKLARSPRAAQGEGRAATHAENLRSDLDPRSTTQGEHITKNSVVITLKVACTGWCSVWNWTPWHGQTAQEA
jgi:hypothetical protein